MRLEILPTDWCFRLSHQEGGPGCFCSRCGNPIGEAEIALRLWPQGSGGEYRFCEACQARMCFEIYR